MKIFVTAALLLCFVVPSIASAASYEPKVLIVCYSHSGNTKAIAEKLQTRTGADLHVVEPLRTYPTDKMQHGNIAKQELQENDLPLLKAPPPDMSGYDLVLVGGPVWWYTVATPLMQFLQQADFSGKVTAPFWTHAGSVGQYYSDFKVQAKNATVIEGLSIRDSELDGAATDNALDTWLAALRKEITMENIIIN